jgi:elongator complex protein 4
LRASGAGAAAAPDDGLKIAWQYRKYIQNQQRADSSVQQPQLSKSSSNSSNSSSVAAAAALAAGVGREWCHQFDLTRSLTADAVRAAKLQLTCCCTEQQQGPDAVHAAAVAATGFLSNFQPKGPMPGKLLSAHWLLSGALGFGWLVQ